MAIEQVPYLNMTPCKPCRLKPPVGQHVVLRRCVCNAFTAAAALLQEKCDTLFRDLLKSGYPCLSLHGGKDQSDRECTITDFKVRVLRVHRHAPSCASAHALVRVHLPKLTPCGHDPWMEPAKWNRTHNLYPAKVRGTPSKPSLHDCSLCCEGFCWVRF